MTLRDIVGEPEYDACFPPDKPFSFHWQTFASASARLSTKWGTRGIADGGHRTCSAPAPADAKAAKPDRFTTVHAQVKRKRGDTETGVEDRITKLH
jgi:hypothetical protein